MPSTTSSSVSRLLASSTVITPSLPTFFIASAFILPIDLSPLAAMAPTWATSSVPVIFLARALMSSTAASTARSMPRLRSIGFMPAATDFTPSRTIAAARTVAVVVPSPAMSFVFEATSHHLGAHVLELVGELDLLGDGDAVLGDARRTEALVEHDVAALGAERHFHRVGENIDAAQHALAGIAAKADFLGCHCSIPL